MTNKPVVELYRGNKASRFGVMLNQLFIVSILSLVYGDVVFSGQPMSINEVQRKIIPSHEIWLKYEKIKYDMSPEGQAERERRMAEIVAEQARREAEEKARKEADAKTEVEKAAAKRAAERERKRAEAAAEQERKEAEEKEAAERAKQERKEVEAMAAAERAEQERKEAEAKRIAEAERKANEPINLIKAVRVSGFKAPTNRWQNDRSIDDFAYYGNAELKDQLYAAQTHFQKVDAFEKQAAQARIDVINKRIKAAQAEVVKKTYFAEYAFFIPNYIGGQNVQVTGDHASFDLTFDPGITTPNTGDVEILFPMPGVTGTRTTSNTWTGITISVRGNVKSIQELVRNKDNYKVWVLIKNLQGRESGFGTGTPSAEVQEIRIIKKG